VKTHLSKLFYVFAGAVLLAGVILAGEPPVKITHGWVRAVPLSSEDSVAYMTLTNDSEQPFRLTSGSTPIAEMVMPMVTRKKSVNGKEVSGMENVDALVIPAHGELVLAPDGDHLMLMGLKKHPKPGEKVKFILRFDPGKRELTLELPVSMMQP
jgi:copper(I)-binding protein